MRVVLKVQREDGQYTIRELHVPSDTPEDGMMMTKHMMVIGNTFVSMFGEVNLLPDRKEADEL
jgi:hypothetical protein